MSQEKRELSIVEMANRFIVIANQLVKEDEQDVGSVGDAIRYAAAQFNSHEASLKSDNLENDKDNAIQWFTEEYRVMLTKNINDVIAMAPVKENEQHT